MKYIKQLSLITAILFNFNSIAMDPPHSAPKENQIVHIKTSNGETKGIEQWKIEEMKTLLILLEDQKDNNSQNNPITASITSDELNLLSDCLTAIVNGEFDTFYANLIATDTQLLKPGQPPISLEGGQLRTLINAAQKIQATGISAFCLSKIMPSDIQKNHLVPLLMTSIKQKLKLIKKAFIGHLSTVSTVAFSPDGKYIVSGSDVNKPEENLIIWDTVTNKIKHRLVGHSDGVTIVAFSPDGKQIVSGSKDKKLILWNTETGQQEHILEGHRRLISTAAFSPNGKQVVSGSDDKNLMLWNTETGQREHILEGHGRKVRVAAFSPDGTIIVSGSGGKTNNLIIWDPQTGQQKHILEGHTKGVTTLAISSDGNRIVSGSENKINNVILWNTKTRNPEYILPGYFKEITSVAISPDGNTIVCSGNNNRNNVIIWDLIKGQIKYSLSPHTDKIIDGVAFSPDGRVIALRSMSEKNNLTLWDTSTGQQMYILEGNPKGVRAIAFNPNSNQIISAGYAPFPFPAFYDNNLVLFSLLTEEEKNALENCTFDQAQILYELSLAPVNKGKIIEFTSPFIIQRLQSLPPILQNIVTKYLKKVVIPKP